MSTISIPTICYYQANFTKQRSKAVVSADICDTVWIDIKTISAINEVACVQIQHDQETEFSTIYSHEGIFYEPVELFSADGKPLKASIENVIAIASQRSVRNVLFSHWIGFRTNITLSHTTYSDPENSNIRTRLSDTRAEMLETLNRNAAQLLFANGILFRQVEPQVLYVTVSNHPKRVNIQMARLSVARLHSHNAQIFPISQGAEVKAYAKKVAMLHGIYHVCSNVTVRIIDHAAFSQQNHTNDTLDETSIYLLSQTPVGRNYLLEIDQDLDSDLFDLKVTVDEHSSIAPGLAFNSRPEFDRVMPDILNYLITRTVCNSRSSLSFENKKGQ